jgi:hypothetical protein
MKRILVAISALVAMALIGPPGAANAADKPGVKNAQNVQITDISARRRRRWRRRRFYRRRRRAYWGPPWPYAYYPGPGVYFGPFGFGFGW